MTFRQATLVSILILLIAGCGSGGEQSRFEIGGLLVEIVSGPARLTISAPDGQVLFDGLPGGRVTKGDPPHVGFAVRRAAADFEMKFGSFRIEEHDAASWRAVTCFANLEQGEEALLFDMLSETDEILASATIEKGDAGEVLLTVSAADKEDHRVSAAFGCEAGEHFIGLGGQGYDVDHRGQTVPVWVQEDGISKIESDEYDEFWYLIGRRHNTHTPMPMFVSSRG